MLRRLLPSLAAILWMAGAGALEPAPIAADTVEELRFGDFFSRPIGPAGLEISSTLRRAAGRRVRLSGYMVQQENPPVGHFLLTPRPVRMSEHADGDADDLPPATVRVALDPTQQDWRVPHRNGLLTLTGVLSVGREEDGDGRISWVRLQLAPEAVRSLADHPNPQP